MYECVFVITRTGVGVKGRGEGGEVGTIYIPALVVITCELIDEGANQ